MSLLQSVFKTSGLSLLDIKTEKDKKNIFNEIFAKQGTNIVELFLANDFIIENKHLLTKEQQESFTAVISACISRGNQSIGKYNQESDVSALMEMSEIKDIKKVEMLSKNFMGMKFIFEGKPISLKKLDRKKYIADETKKKKVKVKFPKFYNQDLDLNKTIPLLNSEEIFSLFVAARQYRESESLISLMLNKKVNPTKGSILEQQIQNIENDVFFNIDIKGIVDLVETQKDFNAYFGFKTMYIRRLIEQFPDAEKIMRVCVEKNGVHFTAEQLSYELKHSDKLSKELKQINNLTERFKSFNVTNKYKEFFPILDSQSTLYDNIINVLMMMKKNMIVSKNDMLSIYKDDVSSKGSYIFSHLKASREFTMLFCEVMIHNIFGEVDEHLTKNMGKEIIKKFKHNSNLIDDYYNALGISSIEHLDKIIEDAVDYAKEHGAGFSDLKWNEMFNIINPYSFMQNISLDEFKAYIKNLEDKAETSEDDLSLFKLMLTHVITVGPIGKMIAIRDYEKHSNKSDVLLNSYDDERDLIKFAHMAEVVNIGKLINLANKKEMSFYKDFFANFCQYHERVDMSVGIAHEGLANRISREQKMKECEDNWSKEKDVVFQYYLNGSKKILKSILDNTPDTLLFFHSIAPFSNIKDRAYMDILLDEIKEEPKYEKIINSMNIINGLSTSKLWCRDIKRGYDTPSLKYTLNTKINSNDMELAKRGIIEFNNLIELANSRKINFPNDAILELFENTDNEKITVLKISNALSKFNGIEAYASRWIDEAALFINDTKRKIREINLIDILNTNAPEKESRSKKKL